VREDKRSERLEQLERVRSSGLGWVGAGAGFPLALHVRTLDMGIEHEGKFASSIQGADR
jgi:hypothetical protein